MKRKMHLRWKTGILYIAIIISGLIVVGNRPIRAFLFLKINCQFHYSINNHLIDSIGNPVRFSPYDYPSYEEAKECLDSILRNAHSFSKEFCDRDFFSDHDLWNHTISKYKLWKETDRYNHIEFTKFLEFVLPYRCSDELPSYYETDLLNKSMEFSHTIPEGTNITSTVSMINDQLKSFISFDYRSHAQLSNPTILDVLSQRKGSCISISSFTALLFRSLGIAVTIDECPFWAHRNQGHAWNVVLTESGIWLPFSGAEQNCNEFNLINDSVKIPKVFRYTFSEYLESVPPIDEIYNIPPVFKNPKRLDVTDEYVSTSTVSINLNIDQSVKTNNNVLYLCVFNGAMWRPIAWSELRNNLASFIKIGNDSIVYLPSFYAKGELFPTSYPFLLTETQKVELIPEINNLIKASLSHYNIFYAEEWKIGELEKSMSLELYYWDYSWKTLGKGNLNNRNELDFDNIPKNALLCFCFNDRPNTWQRIFIIEDGRQVWL